MKSLFQPQKQAWKWDLEDILLSKDQKIRLHKSAGKVMLCVFFDTQDAIYQHVVPPKTKINAVYYVQVLKSLQKHINKKRPEAACSWILHQDNARPHVVSIVWDFLEKRELLMVAHLPNSPRSPHCNFWLFPSLKKALRGWQFSSIQEVVTASQTFFNSLSQADSEKTNMPKWIEGMNMGIKSHGQYFEKGPVTGSDSESN